VVFLPLIATLGAMGYCGIPFTPSTQNLPSFLLVVGVGGSVHILSIFYRRFDAGHGKEEALCHALEHSGLAVMMTSLTTAGGMASFAFADLTPLTGLGIAAPIGVMLAMTYGLVLLPALVALLPIRRRSSRAGGSGEDAAPDRFARALAALGAFSSRRPWWVISVWCGIAAASIHGAAQLEITHRPFEWFAEQHPTRIAAETFNREMHGLLPLEIIIDTGRENGLHDPELLRRIDLLAREVKSLDVNDIEVGQAFSFVDVLKEIHRALNGNDSAFYVVPDDRALIAQELLLFENSGADDLEELVDTRFSKARLSLLVTYHDGFLYLDLVNAIRDAVDEIIGDRAEVHTTGLVELWLRTFFAMLTSTAKSYAIALLVISPLMVLLIGHVRLGLISLVPNLIPIVMGMALMSRLGIHFDMTTMMVGTIVIGVAVDDTIHFMHGFRRAYDRTRDATVAVRETLLVTGRALVITSLVLCSGFFVQMAGSLAGVRNSGLITGCMILAALAADLVLSPAIVTVAARHQERAEAREARHSRD
jgi:predicted RND superfamily exporter protein